MKNETTFFRQLRHIGLSTDSKTRMREALSAYANMHEIKSEPVPVFSVLTFMSSARFPLYATLVTLLLIGGGAVTLGAEGAVPGDIFYAVKVHVNEPLMGLAASGDTGNARLATELAARRVDEVAVLAQSGELTDDKQEYLEKAFSVEVAKAAEHTSNLEKEGDSAAANAARADFQSSIASEAQALGAANPQKSEKTKKFLARVIALSAGENDTVATAATTTAVIRTKGTNTTVALLKQKHASTTASTTPTVFSVAAKSGNLQVTASTSLRAILRANADLPALRKDQAPLSGQTTTGGAASGDLKLGN